MGMMPQILLAKVMHKRLFPKINQFIYNIYYLCIPLSNIDALADGWRFGVDRPALMGFYRRDHGPRDGSDLEVWIRQILADFNVSQADGGIELICMPRILGYVFNPVSFWLCRDKDDQLRAVLYEVNNTFGEAHQYLCAREDLGVIGRQDILETEKVFYVSPFLEREGYYQFSISSTQDAFSAVINYFAASGEKQLLTSLSGQSQPVTRATLRKAFWNYPLITLKTIGLIHFQAAKLFLKGVKHVPKPLQKDFKITESSNITKN